MTKRLILAALLCLSVIALAAPQSTNGSIGTTTATIAARGSYSQWITVLNTHASQTLYVCFNKTCTTSDFPLKAGAAITLPFSTTADLNGVGSGSSTTWSAIGQ